MKMPKQKHGRILGPEFNSQLLTKHSSIAQLVEQTAVNRWVQGSSPCRGANTPHPIENE
jgi:hypothetical protein